MKLPNKLFSYRESILCKFPIILSELDAEEYTDIYELYKIVEHSFDDVSEFIVVLDCLFALGKIQTDFNFRGVRHVI